MEKLTQAEIEMLESDDPTKFDANLMLSISQKAAEVTTATRERLENKD